MANGVLGVAVSGLVAFQRSLQTTTHNIANVNTEGYSRQRVETGTTLPEFTGGGFIGTGVEVNNITRSYDQFISAQLRTSSSNFGEVDSYSRLATQVDNLLADEETGLAPSIQGFFDAVNDVANDPSSIASREVMLINGDSLEQRFGVISERFEGLRSQVNSDLKDITNSINIYSETIADLNKTINADLGRANGQQQPNDLLDKRDVALNKLSELVDISVIPQSNGMIEVVMSNGQPLVMDGQFSKLGTQRNELDPGQLDITLTAATGSPQLIGNQISGGKLAGTMRFSEEILAPAQQKLGAVAAAVAMEFNAIHETGFDLDGNPGEPFFKFDRDDVVVRGSTQNTSPAIVTAGFNDININPAGASSADIDTSDYLLKFDGTDYTLTRMNDDTVIALTESAGSLTPTNPSDKLPGITLEINSAAAAGDEFFIRPTYQAAKNLAMNISDPRQIAAATNLDTDGVTVIPGPLPGDNRNALNLANLANSTGMFGGTTSFQGAYGEIVSKVGGLTHAANVGATAQENLLNNAIGARENLAGVNLDEEAANLIKYQQAFQAAAQTISVASSLFDTLLGAVR
jgi:flagellar hook-associated protein 1 FlgK